MIFKNILFILMMLIWVILDYIGGYIIRNIIKTILNCIFILFGEYNINYIFLVNQMQTLQLFFIAYKS